tara:strand:- start:64952 stop:65383 length:432 start_codon:yes stop_codon:yes gene_type:complete
MGRLSSVQRRNNQGLIAEAGFVPYMGGTESGLPRKQMVTPEGSPAGQINQIGELGQAGELGEDPGMPIGGNEAEMALEEIKKIRQCLGTLEESSVSLEQMLNGMFNNETVRLSKIASYLTAVVEKLEGTLVKHVSTDSLNDLG